jgi:hypothetical protein
MPLSNLDKLVPNKYDFVDRYLRVWYKLKRAKRRAHMDFINPVPLQQIYGIGILLFARIKIISRFDRCAAWWFGLWYDWSWF